MEPALTEDKNGIPRTGIETATNKGLLYHERTKKGKEIGKVIQCAQNYPK